MGNACVPDFLRALGGALCRGVDFALAVPPREAAGVEMRAFPNDAICILVQLVQQRVYHNIVFFFSDAFSFFFFSNFFFSGKGHCQEGWTGAQAEEQRQEEEQKLHLNSSRQKTEMVSAAAAGASTLALASLVALTVNLIVSVPRMDVASLEQTTGLSYLSGPISAGPASAHMEFGEPNAEAYLTGVAQRGSDPSIAIKSPSSIHTEPYHGGVNRWRERRATPYGDVYPTFWGTSPQDVRPVAPGNENWSGARGFGPNHQGVGAATPYWPTRRGSASKSWGKAAENWGNALDNFQTASDSASRAAMIASVGFYPGLAPRAPEYADDAWQHVDRASATFGPYVEEHESYPYDVSKPVHFNGETYYY